MEQNFSFEMSKNLEDLSVTDVIMRARPEELAEWNELERASKMNNFICGWEAGQHHIHKPYHCKCIICFPLFGAIQKDDFFKK